MKPISAESTFDGNRLAISFSAEERIDFRQLVGKLSSRLNRRVEMRQVSARDEARLVGGYGQCGRRLCCTLLSATRSRSRSAWQKTRTCRSTPRRSPAAAVG